MARGQRAPGGDPRSLAVGPFGPWVAHSETPAPDLTPEFGFGIGPDEGEQSGPPVLGTALDEFLPIYWLLGHATKHHPAYAAHEVDLLDLTVLAMLLGVTPEAPEDPHGPLTGDYAADAARLLARRMAEAKEQSASSEG